MAERSSHIHVAEMRGRPSNTPFRHLNVEMQGKPINTPPHLHGAHMQEIPTKERPTNTPSHVHGAQMQERPINTPPHHGVQMQGRSTNTPSHPHGAQMQERTTNTPPHVHGVHMQGRPTNTPYYVYGAEFQGRPTKTHVITPQPRRYRPAVTSHPTQPSSLPMTSHHHLLPRYINWSPVNWLPRDSNEFIHPPHAPFPQTWECSIPNFSEIHQIGGSTGEVIPQAQFQGNLQRNQQWYAVERPPSFIQSLDSRKDPANEREAFRDREEWIPIIKDFFSVENVPFPNPSNKTKAHREKYKTFERSSPKHPDYFQELTPKYFKKLEHGDNQLRTSNETVTVSKTETPAIQKPFLSSQHSNQVQKDDAVDLEKPYKCQECGKGFRQPGNLTRHEGTHTLDKSHVCTHCNKSFNRASNLHTHMKTHSDHKEYTCDFCGKGFHQKIDKRIHSYTHTGEKPYKCQKCGRGFKQLTHLNYHMRTHSDEHMYHCTHCGKGFNQKGNLQAHIYRHTGERPFKCDECGKGFTLRSTLNTHLRTHALQKPFVCQYCNKAFYQKNALKMHHIASHPIIDGKSIL